jgi:hypothetical protein
MSTSALRPHARHPILSAQCWASFLGKSLGASLLLAGVMFARAVTAQGNDQFMQFIRDVEFGNTPGIQEQRVVKWRTPINVDMQFTAKTAPPIVASIVEAFDVAGQASGLPTEFFRGTFNAAVLTADWKAGGLEKQVNMISNFYMNKDKTQAMQFISYLREKDQKCGLRLLTDTGGYLQGGLILVDVGNPDTSALQHCSVRTVAALYGLASLSIADTQPYPSITNKAFQVAQLSEFDKKFLHLLYNPSIRSGMTQQEALPVFESLVHAMSPK